MELEGIVCVDQSVSPSVNVLVMVTSRPRPSPGPKVARNDVEAVGDLPVDSETLSPARKKSLNGFRSYVKNSALLLKGDMASPICFK